MNDHLRVVTYMLREQSLKLSKFELRTICNVFQPILSINLGVSMRGSSIIRVPSIRANLSTNRFYISQTNMESKDAKMLGKPPHPFSQWKVKFS